MKKSLKYVLLVLILTIFSFTLFGCGEEEDKIVRNPDSASNSSKNESIDYEQAAKDQMANPEKGEKIAIFRVRGFGEITVKFFEDSAPKAVENFLKHAEDGYYNGTKFHRVMEEFMIQGGDPKGDGTGGESIWGKGFGEEIDKKLVPYRGALCMASTGYGTNGIGSQFFIVQANYNENYEAYFKGAGFSSKLMEQYKNYGGYLSLYTQYTVFGQVIEGMEVVDRIAKVEKTYSQTGELSVPVEEIILDSVEVRTY